MDVSEVLSRAWKAVEDSGIPEGLQAVALKEAIEILRDASAPAARSTARSAAPTKVAAGASHAPDASATVDEDAFFGALAKESGVPEHDLRDTFQLADGGTVHVIAATKDLGSTVAEQARTVIALVAGARGRGLNEKPVSAEAVRDEVKRKHCWQANNFALQHLGRLKGFNAGASHNDILLTSKWVEEFAAAVAKAHGQSPAT